MALHGVWEEGANEAGEKMNDYKRIRNSTTDHYRKLTPKTTRSLHLESVKKIDTFLTEHDPRHTIIVTHHAPSALSLPEYRRPKLISCAYASHLDSLIEKHQPVLWVHGHIHHNNDYHIGQTRIISNPQAYPGEMNSFFNPELFIDL
jgi:Icc-related predicted phosphoesterase